MISNLLVGHPGNKTPCDLELPDAQIPILSVVSQGREYLFTRPDRFQRRDQLADLYAFGQPSSSTISPGFTTQRSISKGREEYNGNAEFGFQGFKSFYAILSRHMKVEQDKIAPLGVVA